MAAETSKIKTKLANLNASLGELESLLEPLLAQSLPESLIGLEPIQQAKLQTVLPYVVYDLIFIYLKAKGIDPKTHSVVSELDRVRQYFEKITTAENPPLSQNLLLNYLSHLEVLNRFPERTEVDKDAAGRFIKHAIAQSMAKPNASSPPTPSSVPIKITTKMIARARYEHTLKKELQELGEEEEAELQTYDEPDSSHSSGSGDRDQLASALEDSTRAASLPSKRRRSMINPFIGYGEQTNASERSTLSDRQESDSQTNSVPAPSPEVGKTKKRKRTKKNKTLEDYS